VKLLGYVYLGYAVATVGVVGILLLST